MPPGGGGTTTSTSVFNMVLNTIGASGFASAMTSAQNGINGVVVSINKATQAAASGRVNNELQQASYEKLAAGVVRSQASLDLFRAKVEQNSATISQGRVTVQQFQDSIDVLSGTLTQQLDVLDRLDPASAGYGGRLTQINSAIKNTTDAIANLTKQQNEVNTAVDKAASKEQLYQAQLAAREARLKAQTVAMNELKQPLTGFESFVATLTQIYDGVDKVTRTLDKMSLTVQRVIRIWEHLKEITSAVTGGGGGSSGGGTSSAIEAAIAPEMALGQAVADTASKFSILGQAVGTALGQAFVDIVEGAIQVVGQLAQQLLAVGKTALDASGTAERFIISLRAMIGVSRVAADANLDLKTAIAQSAEEAAGLYAWAVKLGVLSPFTIQAAKDSLQLALAFQFTTRQAVDLTQATFDWASATGKSTDQVTQVVRMLGQMNSLGKFSGRILMELGLAGISTAVVLQEMSKQTGISVDKLKELEAQGKITGEQGINAILGFMHKFDGAAKQQAGTIQGLIESLQEMGPELLKDFAGPLDVVSGRIGGVIGVIQKRMSGLVNFLQQDWIPEVLTRLGNGLGGIAESAFTWGENLVNQFANGMLAAIGSILSALTSIGNLIAYWLQPGSPPKILPDIGDWGKSAINEFFKGFGMGDFNLFNGIGSTIEKHLRAVLVKEPGDKIGILNNIFGERQAVAQAIAELDKNGKIVESTFQTIFSAMGGATQETQNYIRTSVALEQQNRKVTAAQKELDDVTKKYNDLLKPVQDNIQKITDAQANLADEQQKTMLELILKDPNATLAEKARAKLQIDQLSAQEKQRTLVAEAKKEVDTAQAKVDAETAKQTALQATLDLQKSILSAEDDQVALMQEYYDLMKQIANQAAASGGGGGGNLAEAIKKAASGPIDFPKVKITLPKWVTDLEAQFNEAVAAIQKALGAINTTLEPVWKAVERFKRAWGDLFKDFSKYGPEINNWIAELVAWTVKAFSVSMPASIDNLTDAIKHFQGIWDKNHIQIEAIAAKAWKFVVTVFLNTVFWITWSIDRIAQLLDFDWLVAWLRFIKSLQEVQTAVGNFMSFIKLIVDTISLLFAGSVNLVAGYIWGFFTGDWIPFWKAMWQYAAGLSVLISIVWRVMTGVINTIVKTFVGDILGKWADFLADLHWKFFLFQFNLKQAWSDLQDKIKTSVSEWIPELVKTWKAVWKGIEDKSAEEIITALAQFTGWIAEVQLGVTSKAAEFSKLGSDMIQGIIDGAANMAQALIDAVVGPVKDAIEAAKKLLNANSPSRLTRDVIGKPMGEGIVAGLLGQSDNITSAMTGMLSGSVKMVGGPGMVAAGASYNSSNTTNFNYNPSYGGNPSAVSDNFALMQAMAG